MREELNLQEIIKHLKGKFDLEYTIINDKISDKIAIEGIYEYLNFTYCYDNSEIENLATEICDCITSKYDCYCDYSILDMGYELTIVVF
ncbi:hypothetical protein [Clostridium sp.]|uniref:hypothetical protein n=1 Tax=Clostridium sp. TaxID=1506 RepID=UPI001D70FCD3|nr:hypothetical protein [Clostridium sp.]MBS5307761.1 hypothetical protein [Clostridium sp.]